MAHDHDTYSGPWALVTGASDGIGAATAKALAAKGYNLILVARRRDRLDALAADLGHSHEIAARVVAADLGQTDGVEALLQDLASDGMAEAEISLAVLAAGFGASGPFLASDIEIEADMIAVNCTAVLRLTHAMGNRMAARGSGQLVLLGSLVGFQGNAMSANYSATKAYVQTLAEGLAVELAPKGIQVLSVAPGPVATGFAERAKMSMGSADTPDAVAKDIVAALGRRGTIRPGFWGKLLGWNMALTPRPLRIRILSRIMAGMADPKG